MAKRRNFVPIQRHRGERSTRDSGAVNTLLREGGKLTCCKMNANICRFLLSACTLLFFFFFFLGNLWSFKTAGGQTASCLKFMKHLFNSSGRDLPWQPLTSSTSRSANLTFVRTTLDNDVCSMTDYSLASFASLSWVCLDRGNKH